ncbi:hypothetical protein [Spirosoma litoris]
MIEQFYVDYFTDLASRCPDIGHSESDCHFWEMVDTDSLKDLTKAVKDTLSFPALVLRPFTDENNYENDNPVQVLSGAFTVLLKVENNDWDQIRSARREARKIALSILAQLRKDALPQGQLHSNKIHLMRNFPGSDEPLVAGTATGWTYEFDWRLALNMASPGW